MDKKLYEEFVNVISSYYPITDLEKNQVREIVADKINHLEAPSNFRSMCDDFASVGKVEDLSYLQFPNRKLYLETIEDVGNYKAYKNFAICVSLLCPYYTFFYEYEFKLKTNEGFLRLAKICFLRDKKFDLIKQNFDIATIDSIIKAHFPHHSYVDHYALLANEVSMGLPFGHFKTEQKAFTILRYLFDNNVFDQYFN